MQPIVGAFFCTYGDAFFPMLNTAFVLETGGLDKATVELCFFFSHTPNSLNETYIV